MKPLRRFLIASLSLGGLGIVGSLNALVLQCLRFIYQDMARLTADLPFDIQNFRLNSQKVPMHLFSTFLLVNCAAFVAQASQMRKMEPGPPGPDGPDGEEGPEGPRGIKEGPRGIEGPMGGAAG
ncbi:unnamed protein product [Cercopithifilaria johnstoni]|uniref:Collagen triple helix repeat protein n=1 Tax=Cercopithifilaria johnstoni TaxID=2874296 RepID=A0A8J2LWI7_9BILA|nr:unnamed protein product [Cercopithifilaria johnstoni]